MAAAFLLAWLITLLIWRRTSRRSAGAGTRCLVVESANAGSARRALRQACAGNDAKAAAAALLAWAGVCRPADPPRDLGTLAARLPAEVAAPVLGLDQALFADGQTAWQGMRLWAAVKTAFLEEEKITASEQAKQLAPLYPQRP